MLALAIAQAIQPGRVVRPQLAQAKYSTRAVFVR